MRMLSWTLAAVLLAAGVAAAEPPPWGWGVVTYRVDSPDPAQHGLVVSLVLGGGPGAEMDDLREEEEAPEDEAEPAPGPTWILPTVGVGRVAVRLEDGAEIALTDGRSEPDLAALAREDARDLLVTIRTPRAEAVRQALGSPAYARAEIVKPSPQPWTLRLVAGGDPENLVEVRGAVASAEFPPSAGTGEQLVRLPLDAAARKRIRDLGDPSVLSLEVGFAFPATLDPDLLEEALDIGLSAGFSLAPVVLSVETTTLAGTAAIERALRDHQGSRWASWGLSPAWGFDRITRPALPRALRAVPASKVDWSGDVCVLVDPRFSWNGPVAALRDLAARPEHLEQELRAALDRFRTRGGFSLDRTETWGLCKVPWREEGTTGDLSWWEELAPTEQQALLERCAKDLVRIARLSERPTGTIVTLACGGSQRLPAPAQTAGLRQGIAWHRVYVFGALHAGNAPLRLGSGAAGEAGGR